MPTLLLVPAPLLDRAMASEAVGSLRSKNLQDSSQALPSHAEVWSLCSARGDVRQEKAKVMTGGGR